MLQLFVTIHLPECFAANKRELPQWKSCVIKICLRACSHSQEVGVLRSPLPASLFPASYRWARLATHRCIGPHIVCIPCSHALRWPCSHRTCVIAKRLGSLRRLAHAAGQGSFMLAPPYLGALLPLVPTVHTEVWCQTTGDNFPSDTAVLGVFQGVFCAPLGETVPQVIF